MFRCSVFRNDAVPVFRVPVFRCSGVPGFTNSHANDIQLPAKYDRQFFIGSFQNYTCIHLLS